MFLLRMFTANPMTMLYVGLAIAAVSAAGAGYAAWEVNGWRLGTKVERAERERDLAVAQGRVLAQAVNSCSAGVDIAKKASDGAAELGAKLLAEAKRLNAGGQGQVDRIEAALRNPTGLRADGKPKGCDDAWDFIEQQRGKP